MPIEKVHEFQRPTKAEAAALVRRAIVAWLASGEPALPGDASGFRMHQGLGYVVLRDGGDVLGVYRVRPDNGALRRLKRWPSILNAPRGDVNG